MQTVVLDTNTLVRFFTGEPVEQAQEVAKLFASAEQGEVRLLIHPLVLAETVFVLTGFYRHERDKVASYLSALVISAGFHATERERTLQALKLFGAGNLDFVDCYLAAMSIQEKLAVVSFGQELGKLHGVVRKSPREV